MLFVTSIQKLCDHQVKQHFRTTDELLSFIEQVRVDNHDTLGRWTAAQIFFHLAGAFDGSLHALPAGYPRVIRFMVRPLRTIVTKFRFPPWLPIPASIRFRLEPPEGVQFEEQKARLVTAIRLFDSYVGRHPPHPVLGELTRNEWIGFHLRHSSHHLSFIRITA